jgi:hypothetical protein
MKRDILRQYTDLKASLEQERTRIVLRLKEIEAALGDGVSVPLAEPTVEIATKPERRMSAAGKRAIAAAAKARWAAFRARKAGGSRVVTKARGPGRPKGKMSAAGRAAIVAAQKARWARVKAEKAGRAGVAAPKAVAKPKKNFSPAARARLAAAAKARWARAKAAGKSKL